MSRAPCYRINEYGFPLEPEFKLKLPTGARLLRAGIKSGRPVLWALVDKHAEVEDVEFILVGETDEFSQLDDIEHVSSFLAVGNNIAIHLFVHRPK
jgi:hypothetical protein